MIRPATDIPNPARSQMHLVTRRALRLRPEDQWFDFHAGESIHTVDAYQCAVESFGRLAGPVGWGQEPVGTDPESLFSVQLLRSRGAENG